jgi:hypothetical protein
MKLGGAQSRMVNAVRTISPTAGRGEHYGTDLASQRKCLPLGFRGHSAKPRGKRDPTSAGFGVRPDACHRCSGFADTDADRSR